MLYTGKGDDGTTYFFGSKERFGKDTPLVEALGTLDELGSLLGLIRTQLGVSDSKLALGEEILVVQENLFIIQAELAGADKHIEEVKVREMENRIGEIENMLPPIKTFFIAGTNMESAWLDYARTIARRAERRVVALEKKPEKWTLAYLNRLSSLLYAFARLLAKESGEHEKAPTYL
jgi:cob(I)alamin adenosyltransferase